MKTETQIAQENIESMKSYKGNIELYIRNVIKCGEHKSSCERWLEFLENKILSNIFTKEKITNLKQAIKLYSENGI
ncbi:hypothetical protein LCGC14_0477790 [marine sediment metagenome]|uniref:Uncharacterized protein n=1 Tax=marine sediment metagenome TaxID=412755 RepID=A0A0F9VJ46_9ZZZZ